MKSDQLYQELKQIAESLGVVIFEKSFRNVGIPVQSGHCRIRGRDVVVLDRNVPVIDKAKVLAECLADMPLEHVYIMPALREYINRWGGGKMTPSP